MGGPSRQGSLHRAGVWRPVRRLSVLPDERHVVAHIHDDAQGGGDLWSRPRARHASTTDVRPGARSMPGPLADGAVVAWRSSRTTPSSIFRKSSDGAGEERVWIQMDRDVAPLNWSKNWLVFEVIGKAGTPDLWIAPATAAARPGPISKRNSLNHSAASRLTSGGWPTTATKAARWRSTSVPFRMHSRPSGRIRAVRAAAVHTGDGMAAKLSMESDPRRPRPEGE